MSVSLLPSSTLYLFVMASLATSSIRSSCHNHEVIVGDGHGSDAGRRSQLRPAQWMKLSLSSSGFLFGSLEVGNICHTNSKSVVGFQPTEDVP